MAESSGGSSVAVMADAQFGNVRVLMPYTDFEDDYQGRAGSIPIAFPGGEFGGLSDQAAGHVDGYRLNQQKGHPVPRGSRISIGIPLTCGTNGVFTLCYRYWLVFRDQNVRTTRNPQRGGVRQPWHYPRMGQGATDTTLVVPTAFTPIDARYHCMGYEQSEPAVGSNEPGILHIYPEAVIPEPNVIPNPLVHPPNGVVQVGSLQQGIYDTAFVPPSDQCMRDEFQVDCDGDEIIILAQRIPDDGDFGTWDFDAGDAAFSNIFGRGGFAVRQHVLFEDGGIRVCTGTNP